MKQETQWTTIFWEGWTAQALCAAAVLWPGLALAVAVPAVWAGWWMLAQRPKPLPEEVVMEKQGKIHIVTEEVFL